MFTGLLNTYYALRHGQSQANLEHTIASDFQKHKNVPLTDLGKTQAQQAGQKIKERLGSNFIIVSSDYARAYQTAEIVAKVCGINPKKIQKDLRLRDRSFGDYNGTSADNLDLTWERDKTDPTHKTNQVESVVEVLVRTTSLIESLEETYTSKTILLVSHGDTLTILETAFKQVPPETFKSLTIFGNAELRKLEPTQT